MSLPSNFWQNARDRADSLSPNTTSPTSSPLIQRRGLSSDNIPSSAPLDADDGTFQLRRSSEDIRFGHREPNQGYQTIENGANGNGNGNAAPKRKKSSIYSRKSRSATNPPPPVQETTNGTHESEAIVEEQIPFWERSIAKFRTVELENKGSVARDHLALGKNTFYFYVCLIDR